jgi:hypothetical protein
MLYEDADAGRYAKRFSDKVMEEIGDEGECVRNLWSFDVLGITEVRNAAAGAARNADLVIISASGKCALSREVEEWLELWAWLIDRAHPTLVALSREPTGSYAASIHDRLRRLAREKGVRFIPQSTPRGGADVPPIGKQVGLVRSGAREGMKR